MNDKAKLIVEQARKLSVEERIEIAEQILATVRATDPAIDAAWVQEGEERVAAYERGEVETYDADEVLADLRRRSRTKF